jgi:hypothetical protein
MTDIQYAVLNFGFAESARLGTLVLANTGTPFTDQESAFQSLAQDLLAMYRQDTGMNDLKNECCEKNVGSNYCPECGTKLEDDQVYGADFQTWLLELLERDLDSIGTLEEDVQDRDVVWELGHPASELVGETPDRVLVIAEYAERSLSEALHLEE